MQEKNPEPVTTTKAVKVFGMSSPNVLKVILMLEEIGAPYQLTPVNVFAGEQHESFLRTKNPNGKVPILVDPEGLGGVPVTVFESGAILIYLAEKYREFLPAAGAARYGVLQWLMLQMGGLGPMAGQAIHFSVLNDTDRYARRRFTIELGRQLNVLEKQLSENAFLAGACYSIADMAMFPWMETLIKFFPIFDNRVALLRWYTTIAARPASMRMAEAAKQLAVNDRINMKAATPEMLDRYFGRVPLI